ncbi:hypothetical protein BC831DRAFT_512051 [Entophlyctis helioformis]|nr:hypothetical protein BC831DRAFT_512051 [Entophlyctis helioformis]
MADLKGFGTLRGFDQTTNLILSGTIERIFSAAGSEDNALGLYVVRGDSMQVDAERDAEIQWPSIAADPLPAVHHSLLHQVQPANNSTYARCRLDSRFAHHHDGHDRNQQQQHNSNSNNNSGNASAAAAAAASSSLVKRSVVQLKKGLLSSDKYVVLCAPLSVQDIQSVYELLFVSDPSRPVDARSVPWLGNIAFAAVKATPLLVILPSETRTDSPTFIHFDEVRAISDEVAVSSACTFVLHLAKTDLKFVCRTSTDYQDWIRCLTMAFEIAASSFQANAEDLRRRSTVLAAVQQQQQISYQQASQVSSQPHVLVNEHYQQHSIARHESMSQLFSAGSAAGSSPNLHGQQWHDNKRVSMASRDQLRLSEEDEDAISPARN